MRVLLTNTAKGWSGEPACVEMVARGLAARGCHVHVASRAGSDLGHRLRDAGLAVTELDLRRDPVHLWRDLRTLRRLATRLDPDVVHCNASRDTWLCATVFRLLHHRAVRLRTKHNLKRIRRSVFNRFLYRRALNALIAPSPMVLDQLQASPVTCQVQKRLVPYGIRLEGFRGDIETRRRARRELLGRFPGITDPLIAVYLSRMTSRKNPELAVQSVLRLARWRATGSGSRPVVLAVVGSMDGPVAQSCVDLAAGNPHIAFLGFQTDVARILAGADVFLLPSLEEAFGLAAVEAMACGTVPILPRSGSFPQMLGSSRAGVLYEPGDQVDGICNCLLDLTTNGAELGERSRAALAHARTFDADDMVDGTLDYYRELIDRRAWLPVGRP